MRRAIWRKKRKSFNASAHCVARCSGQKGDSLACSFSLDFPTGGWRHRLYPIVAFLANRCAIRISDAAISALLTLRGRSRGWKRELASAPSRDFQVQIAGGEKKKNPSRSLQLSLSLVLLHVSPSQLTGSRAHRAGHGRQQGDGEEGSRHFGAREKGARQTFFRLGGVSKRKASRK
jgi:hypothetical protein